MSTESEAASNTSDESRGELRRTASVTRNSVAARDRAGQYGAPHEECLCRASMARAPVCSKGTALLSGSDEMRCNRGSRCGAQLDHRVAVAVALSPSPPADYIAFTPPNHSPGKDPVFARAAGQGVRCDNFPRPCGWSPNQRRRSLSEGRKVAGPDAAAAWLGPGSPPLRHIPPRGSRSTDRVDHRIPSHARRF